MSKKIKVALYARVSTLLGQNPMVQLHELRQYSEARGFEIFDEYIDEGISGSKSSRPALDKMMSDAKKKRFDYILTVSIDRMGRSLKNLILLLEEMDKISVRPIFLRESIDTSTSAGRLMFSLISSISEYERAQVRERVRAGIALAKLTKSKTGNWRHGRPPISPTIKEEVIALRKQGLSLRQIADKVKSISKTSVSRILKENNIS